MLSQTFETQGCAETDLWGFAIWHLPRVLCKHIYLCPKKAFYVCLAQPYFTYIKKEKTHHPYLQYSTTRNFFHQDIGLKDLETWKCVTKSVKAIEANCYADRPL